MNSLKIKILSITILITISAVSVATWNNVKTQSLMVEQMAAQNSRILSQTIRNSIISSMLSGRHEDIVTILGKIEEEASISSPRIFDENGKILISTNTDEIGRQAPAQALETFRGQPDQFALSETAGEIYTSTLPINNAPECNGCHDPNKNLLGIFNVNLSIRDLQSLQIEGREAQIFSSVSLLLIMIASLIGFVLYYVDSPIQKLVNAMTHLEEGNFSQARANINSSREMALLSDKFNRMVERLYQLIDTTVRSERERAVSHEKREHQSKLASMHMTLEERLKEIEKLNISLEERIEEVEEANFKIADLASNLEDRNTTLAQVVNRLSSLYEMGLVVNSTMDLKHLFNLLLDKAIEALDADIGYILLYDKETEHLKIGDAIGVPSSNYDSRLAIPLEPGGVSKWVIENRHPLLIKRIDDQPEFCRTSRLGFTRDSVICAPLFVRDEIFGTITIANKRDGSPFYDQDLELLSTIAAQASIAIKNASLYEEQQQTYVNTVQALVSAIEASDPYTRGHSERVTRYSLALAHKLNFPETAYKDLEQAAILHDIGKIGIEGSTLHKVAELSLNDIEHLRRHPHIGMRILEPIHFMSRTREIIGQHHERFDGTGYPQGICGDDLLIESRILSVADSFDAMTSDRPYRKALPTEVALTEIETHAGSQFDPLVAQCFVEMVRTGQL